MPTTMWRVGGAVERAVRTDVVQSAVRTRCVDGADRARVVFVAFVAATQK